MRLMFTKKAPRGAFFSPAKEGLSGKLNAAQRAGSLFNSAPSGLWLWQIRF